MADVATEEGYAAKLAATKKRLGGIDVLINNAGGLCAGRLEERFEASMRAMIEVNPLSPILLTGMALPDLRQSGQGLVLNVTFGVALIGSPSYATYVGAKTGLAQFGEALRREQKGEGVHVVTALSWRHRHPHDVDEPGWAEAWPQQGVGFRRRCRNGRWD